MPDAEVIEEISVSDDTPVESEYVSSIELDAASIYLIQAVHSVHMKPAV